MKLRMRLSRFPWIVLLAFVLAACASTSSKLASPYVVEVEAGKAVNPTEDGRAAPVQVTVYELSSRQAFDHADFFALFERPREALAQDLLHLEQFVLQPGESRSIERPGKLEAKWLGVVVAFRDIDNAGWREVVALPEPVSTNIYKIWQFSPREETIRFMVDRKEVSLKDREKPFFPKIF
ncbi:type VI secretion system lipoprotein TssJ [Paracandidimonas soli]|uniref:Type VI secretion system protein VasD n=3 Tax=Paracandidimonas soli TaxID=1917182 RepID=A0A4R3UMR8_9BURK|nr:type VI secretion system lipoprotein TssJ [Paracandidimonas soli]TCU92996.1 type VI secretion system protein VasD [Paracandidimonas soli]